MEENKGASSCSSHGCNHSNGGRGEKFLNPTPMLDELEKAHGQALFRVSRILPNGRKSLCFAA